MALVDDDSVIANRCLRNPILIHESTSRDIPINLRFLLLTLNEDTLTENDYLVILAYTMMVETGFIPYQKINDFKELGKSPTFDIKFLTTARTLPISWKDDKGIYKITFALPSLPDQKVCLTALSRGVTVVFTVWLKNTENTPSWCIAMECGKYVLSSKTEFMSHKFFNLKELSQQFKNKITFPARNCLKLHGNVEICCFLDLPLEMKVSICGYLNRNDILKLSETCKLLYELSRSGMVLKKLNLPLQFEYFNKK